MDDKDSDIIQKQSTAIVYLTLLVLLLVIALGLVMFCTPKDKEPKKEQLVDFCGTASLESSSFNAKSLGLNGDKKKGRELFKQNCAVCHSLSDQKITGPGLKGIYDRVPKPEEAWLIKYICNSKKVRESGDAYALNIYKENESYEMTAFDSVLTEKQIKSIIAYISSMGIGIY